MYRRYFQPALQVEITLFRPTVLVGNNAARIVLITSLSVEHDPGCADMLLDIFQDCAFFVVKHPCTRIVNSSLCIIIVRVLCNLLVNISINMYKTTCWEIVEMGGLCSIV